MKAMIVCVSVSHGNTRRVAEVMGEVLGARVVEPEEVGAAELAEYDVVGFGSGIFNQAFHPRLRGFVRSLPDGGRGRAFVFATSGFPPFARPLVKLLERKGFQVVDTFSCRAWDTWLPFKPFGGIRKGRPDTDDLTAARTFAESLRTRITTS
ncbi:flavodoxin family protein [Nocardia blacklockiae]|uniref:flavodoxin family protein n=1 Tax=Nocardia blacklockiae TaxID=480036 RepID=UPI001893DB64|nr:flavodoxin family protein [Nocardia blacklockiae]MBF6169948.1 flavodoxin family protein [Nocardia blacklockiae]